MARIHAYLNFNGNCEEAFTFYEKVFNTKNMGMHRFGDMPADDNFPMSEEDKKKIMNTAIMINEDTMILGSDCIENFGHKLVNGNSTYIMLDTQTAQEAKDLYAALSVNAQAIEMELGEQFWAELYASFQDQFGICWMIHFEGNKKMS
ncbi:VOC family protein [Flavobacterium sp. xlx-214]|uniref:VOC family protein n=1 Tax=unclassified Flavobacterium TaxID=196869 RepID=UPI0013D797B6|nr:MULTISPECIES: VOC family protein [unclassified Flavobacterium]MBA5792623.1 VOC family protein [Flavobacterium sp. xlx-221]QMI83772.1 VOC family protein [Flavobacterium sp. xlx-214]